jgi:hypothetical protein
MGVPSFGEVIPLTSVQFDTTGLEPAAINP